MLHWLAGQKPADGLAGSDLAGQVEPPETPAPVFAVRAFKHAIFGTPQTAQAQPRRHSNTENGRPKLNDVRPSRPGINRPKSSGDAHTLAKQEFLLDEEPLSSPTKGILLSPGTAAARKKNVTFGENVIDNEEKRPMRSGLSEDSPGKFPSLWPAPGSAQKRDESPSKSKRRVKLSEALERAREESKNQASGPDRRGKAADNEDIPSRDLAEPQSESGKYWKNEYDIYRTNTQQEVKKLVTKQKAAKTFAAMKDKQCTELADQLKQEHKKVQRLEAKTAQLASLVNDLQTQLRVSQDAERAHKEEVARLRAPERAIRSQSTLKVPEPLFDHGRAEPSTTDTPVGTLRRSVKPAAELRQPRTRRDAPSDDPVQRPSEPYNPSALSVNEKQSKDGAGPSTETDRAKSKRRDEIRAQSSRPASPGAQQKGNGGRVGGSKETSPSPLQSLNLNTLTSNPKLKHSSFDAESKTASDLDGLNSLTTKTEEEKVPITAQPKPGAGARLSKLLADAKASQLRDPQAHMDDKREDDSDQGETTNPLHSSAPLPSGTTVEPNSRASGTLKENVPPDAVDRWSQTAIKPKPSAIWNSMNAPSLAMSAPPLGKRNTSLTGKDGKEVSVDRIEAARARIAARTRGTSGR